MPIDRAPLDATLTPEETIQAAAALQNLTGCPEWQTLKDIVQRRVLAAREVAFERGLDEIPYWKGVVDGLKMIVEIPREILVAAGEIIKREEKEKREVDFRGTLPDDSGDPSFS